MRREIIAAVSVLGLMTGAAYAQGSSPAGSTGTSGTTAQTPGGMQNPGATSGTTAGPAAGSGATMGTADLASAEKMLGKDVVGKDGEELGEVEDIILDQSGKARQLVISSGGFLGIGERQIAVDFNDAQVDAQADQVRLSTLTQQDVKTMQEFTYSDTTTSLNRNRQGSQGGASGTMQRSTNPGTTPATPPATAPGGTPRQ